MDDSRSALETVAGARERTLAAAHARIELLVDHAWKLPPRRRRGGLLRPLTNAAAAAGKRLLEAITRIYDFRHARAIGVLDLAERRYMLDYGSFARLYADGRGWDGRSGRALGSLPPSEHEPPTPLWLLDVLAGLTEANERGIEDVQDTTCRRFAATIDLRRASEAAPDAVAVPPPRHFEDVVRLPVEVWVDDEHIRRVRIRLRHPTETLQLTETLELRDVGIRLDDLDWSRLPTFRSPQHAARAAGDHAPAWRRALDRVVERRAS